MDRSMIVTNHGVAIQQAQQGNGVLLYWTGMVGAQIKFLGRKN